MLKFGIVTQIDEAKALVRVKFTDMDGVLSYWLPAMQDKTLKDKTYWMPDINEHVVCLLDGHGEEGVVLGAIYSDEDRPPLSSKDKRHIRFEDGSVIEYDRAVKRLTLDLKGEYEITVAGTATVKMQKSLDEEIEEWNGEYGQVIMDTKECTVLGLRCPFTGMPDHP